MSSIELKDSSKLVDDLEQRLMAAGRRGLLSAALRGVQTILTEIIPSRSPMPVDRAVYKSGWRAFLDEDGAVIENLEPEAILIEEGVRAANVKIGRAMLAAIAAWAVRKGIASAEEAPGVAWAIAKSMQRRGIFGMQGMGILRELVERRIYALMTEEIAREIKREFG